MVNLIIFNFIPAFDNKNDVQNGMQPQQGVVNTFTSEFGITPQSMQGISSFYLVAMQLYTIGYNFGN